MEKDNRIEEVINIVGALVTKTLWQYSDILVTPTDLIIIVNQTLLYKVPLKNQGGPIIGISNIESFMLSEPEVFPNDIQATNVLTDLWNRYYFMINNNPIIAQDLELRGNDEFEKLLELKTDQGLKYFRLASNIDINHPILIPMFAGFPNLSKQDTIGIIVYDIDYQHLLVSMHIRKKKLSREIQMMYRTLKI